jgi:hypothetical protein
MTAPDLSGVEQLPQPDPRGWLALRYLPDTVQNAEDATYHNDYSQRVYTPRGRVRQATPTERLLLEWLGHGPLPDRLETQVTFTSPGIWCRRWPELENPHHD